MPSAFNRRTCALYRKLQERVSEKRNKRGHIIRVGRTIPFSLDDFRAAILTLYRSEQGTRQCRYCTGLLSVLTLSPEHQVPLKRGGGLGLDNLDLECCRVCNSRKGGLTPAEFTALLEGLKTFPEAARKDILQRLEIAVQLAAGQRWNQQKSRNHQPTEEETF